MKESIIAVCGVAVIVAGMLGLHHHIEYSGWVLFVGCASLWSVA